MSQSERNSNSKNRGVKKRQSDTDTKSTYRKPNEHVHVNNNVRLAPELRYYILFELLHYKASQRFAKAKTKTQISCAVTSTFILSFKHLSFFCDCTGRFMSDLVGITNCCFSHAKAPFASNFHTFQRHPGQLLYL